MRQDPDFFGDTGLDLLYMARRLSDALKLESILTEAGIDFAVETGTYVGGFLFRRELTGAFFYVPPESLQQARQVLLNHRFRPYAA